MPPRPRRAGFTLFEILNVLAVVGTLIALLVPAIQKVREAAARTQCQSQLGQVGFALHSYHDRHKRFPPGYVSAVDPKGDETGPGWGWAAHLLDDLGQAPLHARLHFSKAIAAPENGGPGDAPDGPADGAPADDAMAADEPAAPAPDAGPDLLPPGDPFNPFGLDGPPLPPRGTRVPILICPAEARATPEGTISPAGVAFKLGFSSYVGVFGGAPPEVDPGAGDGLFYRNSKVRRKDVTDGASQTLAVVERGAGRGPATWVGVPVGATEGPTLCLEPADRPLAGATGDPHPGGTNVLFVDGAVRALRPAIDPAVLKALSTRAGNELVSGADF